MNVGTILHDYGWAGVFLIFAVEHAWPFFSKRIFPQMQRQQQASIEADKEEREFRHQMELRQADAFDKLVETTQSIERFIVSVDRRLEGLERAKNSASKPQPRKRSSHG